MDYFCDVCGNPAQAAVISNERLYCQRCAALFDTCSLCLNSVGCEFETNPSPLPKVVVQTIRQGAVTMQQQIKNPERIKQFCFPCKCFDQDDLICRREERWCPNYNEYIPPSRQTPVENKPSP